MGTKVIAMYDVRGIQRYIYRTPHIQDAMGASSIIEGIIENALRNAADRLQISEDQMELNWDNEEKPYPYSETDHRIKVLYIGGGNAYVEFSDADLCVNCNKLMARYILEKTYSLQLAAVYTEKTDVYYKDYQQLFQKMNQVKAEALDTKPLGALPIMKVEKKTGFPVVKDEKSTETLQKERHKKTTIAEDEEEKILDNLIDSKGVDSTLAIVHMDGNNMGLRIRGLVQGEKDYVKAVNLMRQISHNIHYAYLNTFEEMKEDLQDSENDRKLIRKILVAGDDITYICNAKLALASVEHFSKKITGKVMYGDESKENIKRYGFSVCAGIAYVHSHFPFYIGYEVAEACCDSAKDRAKKPENKDGDRVGNYVDFQICKNVQCRNLDRVREKEYRTPTGENLLIRPYYVPTDYDFGLSKTKEKNYSYKKLKENIKYFAEGEIPRSFVKQIRNTYPLGSHQMEELTRFLDSRGRKMPDQETAQMEMYEEDRTAKWYDALELIDWYIGEDVQND